MVGTVLHVHLPLKLLNRTTMSLKRNFTHCGEDPRGCHFPCNRKIEGCPEGTESILGGRRDSDAWYFWRSQALSQTPSSDADAESRASWWQLACNFSEHICILCLKRHDQFYTSHLNSQSSSWYPRRHAGPCSCVELPALVMSSKQLSSNNIGVKCKISSMISLQAKTVPWNFQKSSLSEARILFWCKHMLVYHSEGIKKVMRPGKHIKVILLKVKLISSQAWDYIVV